MTEPLDIGTLYRKERTRWMREEAPRRSFQDIVAASVPYWIVIVALVLFGLSAPHTAEIFLMLTPRWGVIAPIGVEFGLLYAAFRRRLARSEGTRVPWTLWAMEILLFITAILVNGAGAFVSVVSVTGLDALSFSAILSEFTLFPATSQAALIMAMLSAFIIPIGTLVAGDGLADLTLERREHTSFREARWQEVAFMTVYRALYVHYLSQDHTDTQARKRALSEVRSYLGTERMSAVRSLSAPTGHSEQRTLPEPTERTNTTSQNAPSGSVKATVNAYLDNHPELQNLSVNGVLDALQSAGVQAGRTSVADVLRERKSTE